MVITNVRVRNFKSIEDSGDIPITKLFGLIGKNNSGKSALFEAIRSIFGDRDIAPEDVHKRNGADLVINLRLAPDYFTDIAESIEYTATWSAADLKVSIVNGEGKPVKLAALKKELPRLLVIPAIRNPANETTAGSKSYLKELIATILAGAEAGDEGVDEKKTPVAKLSRAQLLRVLQFRTKAELTSLSGQLSGNFQNAVNDNSISMEIDTEGDLAKALAYSTSIVDPTLGKAMQNVDILACGTGLQSMAILALLETYAQTASPGNIILMIEEPEVYLHPDLQRKMFLAMRGIARRNQVLFTTHSPIMISELWADESLRLVKRKNGISTFEKISIPDVVTELGIKYEDVLNPKAVVFVEGSRDVEFYEAIASQIVGGADLGTAIKFVSADGYRNIHAYALMSILASTNVACDAHAIVDSDALPAATREKELKDSINSHLPARGGAAPADKIKVHVIGQHELEGFLLDPVIIKVLLKLKDKDIQDRLAFYRGRYLEVQKGAKTAKEASQRLTKYLRPSLIFESSSNPNFQEAYSAEFKNDKDFLTFRDQLMKAWAQWQRTHKKPCAELIIAAGFTAAESLREPIALIKSILKK